MSDEEEFYENNPNEEIEEFVCGILDDLLDGKEHSEWLWKALKDEKLFTRDELLYVIYALKCHLKYAYEREASRDEKLENAHAFVEDAISNFKESIMQILKDMDEE